MGERRRRMRPEERSGPVESRKATLTELASGVFTFRSGARTTRRAPSPDNYRREGHNAENA
jgi:hypothetical protein